MLNLPAVAPLGEALPNSEIFRRLAAKMGFDEPCLRESDDQLAAQAFRRHESLVGTCHKYPNPSHSKNSHITNMLLVGSE